jgi:hypothetical protein
MVDIAEPLIPERNLVDADRAWLEPPTLPVRDAALSSAGEPLVGLLPQTSSTTVPVAACL